MTRFNLATPGREAGHREREGWLAGRFDLFERYCLPSVAKQDEKDFDWIVFFDEHTPDWARQRIARCEAVHPFIPVFTGLFDSTGWARWTRTVIGPPESGRILITTNLDNDDALARDFTARVRRAAERPHSAPPFAVNLPDGLVVSGKAAYRHRHLHNAFTNLVEADDELFRTTMTIRHMELPQHVSVIQAEGPPAWLQVVHGGNVSNKVRGRRTAPAQHAARFPHGLLDAVAAPTPLEQLADAAATPARDLRDTALRLLRRLIPADPGR